MAHRKYDFSEAEKTRIKQAFGYICAACGSDDPDNLSADHWLSGDASDSGVCLCLFCNTVKGKTAIPESLRLNPRNPLKVISHPEYRLQVAANRKAFGVWVNFYRGTNRVRPVAFLPQF